ncbi:YciI family protein, partial [Amycolatopsis mediterranei]
TTIRVRGGEVLLTDGPFTEAKEQIGGFVILDCADLDEALELAARHPAATYGSIEVRPMLGPEDFA